MTVPHYNIVFATPGAAMVSGYVRSMLKTTNALTNSGITWNYMTEYSSLVAHAREMTIGGSGYQDRNNRLPAKGVFTYDVIMWIDSDIEWEPDDVMRLCQSDKEVISGCYLMENREVPAFTKPLGPMMREKDIMKLKKPFEVRAVGFGFLCVKRGVFEAMERPWFSQVEVEIKDEETGNIEYTFPLMGEDVSWCEKVHRMGLKIWVDPLVRVTHQKSQKLLWEK